MKGRFLPLSVLVVILAPLALFTALGVENAPAIAVFVSIVVLWLTELLPLAVTGLLVPVLIALYGILPAKGAFAAFGNPTLFLFVGCFFLARAMGKHGWDRRMSYWILATRLGGRSPSALIAVIGGISFVLSMWVSNTATTAMIAPICLGIANTLADEFDTDRQRRAFTTKALLTTAFSASIGGLATPVGTPPNLFAVQMLADNGIKVTFIQWMSIGLPIALLMFGTLLAIMHFRFRLDSMDLGAVRDHFRGELKRLGPVKREEKQVAAVFALAVTLWTVPGILELLLPDNATIGRIGDRLSMNVVGIGAALLLFLMPADRGTNLEWDDARHIDWGTILLFGGGLTLGAMLDQTGLAASLGDLLFNPDWGFLALVVGAVLFGVIMSEFASNTASAAVVIPILMVVLAEPGFENVSVTLLVMASAFGASYGFMLPVSTPPNAIVYGTGKLKVRDMFTTGIVFDICGATLIILSTLLLNQLGVF